MARRILVPMEGSERSWKAFEHAVSTFEGEEIVVLHVIDPADVAYTDDGGRYDPDSSERARDTADDLLEDVRERFERLGALDTTRLETETGFGQPAREIVKYAESNDVDHIVMGSHGRTGVTQVLLGSVAETVTRRAPVPVTILR